MALNQETINAQLDLLAVHRRTLAHLLHQAAQFGGEVLAPPQTANGIAEARQQIRRIKAVLRKNGVQVEDEPNDKASRKRKSVQSQQASNMISQDKVAGDRVIGGKHVHIIQSSSAPAIHQLRAPVSDFVGRAGEVDQLVQALSKANDTAASISGVRGMGGIGKTELALKVVQQSKVIFPDAQLLVELRGTSSSPLTPEQALQTIIRSFEREAKLPDDLNELKNIYCSVLAGKHALILADDAKDAAQVRPLLPPPGCALLVTSRNRFRLPGMVAFDLATLPPEDAVRLLLEICPQIGEHALELAQRCGVLPLALRVAAGQLATHDARDVRHFLEQLEVERLKHLRDPDAPNDPQASVEASLRLSYETLEPAAKTVLSQLGYIPVSYSVEEVKALVITDRDVDEILELLQRRSLIDWNKETKVYFLHDLVRDFAYSQLQNRDAIKNRWFELLLQYCKDTYDKVILDILNSKEPNISLSALEYLHIKIRQFTTGLGEPDDDHSRRIIKDMRSFMNFYPHLELSYNPNTYKHKDIITVELLSILEHSLLKQSLN